ncbi:amino acid permease, partial [Liquorilactobacillus vini]|uniref:amino acid permease n=1 Tax=Liquorilactobacillus vini TaxID=238015 RepID=UPI00055881F9
MKEDTVPKINSKNHVKRVLKTRHLSMIALGGSIGTGLFVASGLTISSAGPGGALVAYISVGIMVYFLMTSLGEMATYMPISGSFASYAGKFVDPALGFALGWNYWLNWVITLAVDITTVSIIIKFWLPNRPTWIFSLLALGVMFVINIISARSFAETEYWLSLIKILVILIFIFLGFLMIFGKLKQPFTGMQNFTYKKAPFLGLLPMLGAFSTAAFSFQGTELIGITAGESDNPEESIPKATKQIFWRILLFYILSIFVISCLIPYDNPFLLGSSTKDIAISPFTLVFKQSGLNSAASIMNFVILISVLSSANSGIYAATRMLYSLSYHEGALSIF